MQMSTAKVVFRVEGHEGKCIAGLKEAKEWMATASLTLLIPAKRCKQRSLWAPTHLIRATCMMLILLITTALRSPLQKQGPLQLHALCPKDALTFVLCMRKQISPNVQGHEIING